MGEVVEGLVWPEKFALANAWETSPLIRATFRSNSSALLTWVKPNLVGVASLRALSLNRKAIELAIDVWSAHSHVAKSPPVHWLKQEVGQLYALLTSGSDGDKSLSIYVDAWGCKRLISLSIRRWKAPIHMLRDRSLATLFDSMTASWGEQAEEAVDSADEDVPAEPYPEPSPPPSPSPAPAMPIPSSPLPSPHETIANLQWQIDILQFPVLH
ncbi:unnamed protein product [Symbiodinium natans]|uniref:Uncharacterized protein n=1 Tax=Symbiodinium natans TaxID=878477 RepID=A0A812N5J6_9DINO|nr:unnamed protein product [Symbiodinium natans]